MDVERFKNPTYKDIKQIIESGNSLVCFEIYKEDVLNKDFSRIGKLLANLKKIGKPAKKSVVIMCGGYDDVPEELHEIKEVSDYIKELFDLYPHLFYYINNTIPEMEADVWLLNCFADEVETVTPIKYANKSIVELIDEYGFEGVPQIQSYLSVNGTRLKKILKGIITHAKNNKDANGGKKIAIEYAFKFTHPLETLSSINITTDDIKTLFDGDTGTNKRW